MSLEVYTSDIANTEFRQMIMRVTSGSAAPAGWRRGARGAVSLLQEVRPGMACHCHAAAAPPLRCG
eukprot:1926167-Pleurochrysis_carterae.AAC.1